MKTIRASEIGAFLFCKRAYGYQQQGLPSANAGEMIVGSELHARHGRLVAASGCLRAIAAALLLAALVLLAIHIIRSIL